MPGPTELILIFAIVFLLFGAKRLPELGGSIGKSIRNFKDGIADKSKEMNEKSEDKSV